MNFVSCAKWIKKGVAKSNPEKVQLTQEELQKLINSTRDEIKELRGNNEDDRMDEDVQECSASTSTSDKFNLKEYDNEDDIGGDSLFSVGNLIVNTDEDDYKIGEENHDGEEDDDVIKPTDNLIAVGHIEGDASILEIFVYNEHDDDLFVHHDILLPTIPLCLEWLSYDTTDPKPGNLVAVGGMSAVIGIWDLDVVDCLEPAYQLGKFSVKKKRNKSHGHKDAVLDLSWNTNYKHILASGSVDKSVILWDLDIGRAATTFTEFNDKVQCLKWSSDDFYSLLTGSADKTAKLFDCRMTEMKFNFEFSEEIEKVNWNPWKNNVVYFGTNEGSILSYDLRQSKEKLWEIKAHDKEITGLEIDINCPGVLITCSMDEMVKIWDISKNSVELKSSKSFGLGEMQCINLNPDCPYVACIGGTKKKKNFKVVNLKNEMLQPVNTIVDTKPVVLSGPDTVSGFINQHTVQFTENAFRSLSINKKIQSKKKYGHKNKRT